MACRRQGFLDACGPPQPSRRGSTDAAAGADCEKAQREMDARFPPAMVYGVVGQLRKGMVEPDAEYCGKSKRDYQSRVPTASAAHPGTAISVAPAHIARNWAGRWSGCDLPSRVIQPSSSQLAACTPYGGSGSPQTVRPIRRTDGWGWPPLPAVIWVLSCFSFDCSHVPLSRGEWAQAYAEVPSSSNDGLHRGFVPSPRC